MKFFSTLALAALSLAAAAAAANPHLKQVNAVYILSMGNGMDQYLANQLTTAGVVQVVTDPKKADAILTDRLGQPFENKLAELYPTAPTPEQVKKEEEAKEKATGRGGDTSSGIVRVTSSFSSSKGNFFLVDRNSRAVLWSVYEPSRDITPNALTKTAAKVVKRWQADLADKKQGVE